MFQTRKLIESKTHCILLFRVLLSLSFVCCLQCRARWVNVVDPDLKKGPFCAEEQQVILSCKEETAKCKWKTIAARLEGMSFIIVG